MALKIHLSRIFQPFQVAFPLVANALVLLAYTKPFAVNEVRPVPPLVVAKGVVVKDKLAALTERPAVKLATLTCLVVPL